jgi:hypothetical protein
MRHLPLPPWLSSLAAIRIRTLLVGVVFVALVLGLIAQTRRAEERERRLREQLGQARRATNAEQGIRSLFGNLGLVILEGSTRIEVLQAGTASTTPGDFPHLFAPAGREFGKEYADRLGRALLRPEQYGFLNADDDPVPQVGFRFWSGKDSIDILVDRSGSPHQDIWAIVRDGSGSVIHRGGPVCLDDPVLNGLISEALRR